MKRVLVYMSAGGLVLLALLTLATKNKEKIEIPARELPVVDKSEAIVEADSYRKGYMRGYHAFLAQTGTYMPPPVAIAYTSSHPDVPEDQDRDMKGYVDGYHKAAESFQCPR